MKKVILIIALLTISLTLFGQAAVGGWGRGIFLPVIIADDDPTAASLVSWGPTGTRMGFTISGSSDNVGIVLDVLVDNGSVGVGDQQKIWVKPMEMLTLSVGRIFDDTLRGNAGFCANNWMRFDFSMAGDDYVFGRVGVGGQVNFEAAIAPADGAYVYAAFGGSQFDLQNWQGSAPIVVDEPALTTMFKTGQYGAGYDIPGIGVIRAQFIGSLSGDKDKTNGVINAAFKLTMIEGLILDVGIFAPMDTEITTFAGTYSRVEFAAGTTADIALYANYIMDTLGIHFATDIALLEEGDPIWKAGIGVEYGLENGPTIQGDVRLHSAATEDDPIKFGIMAGAKFSYSNGIFGIGIEATNSSYAVWGSAIVAKDDPEAIVITLPIRLEYWF